MPCRRGCFGMMGNKPNVRTVCCDCGAEVPMRPVRRIGCWTWWAWHCAACDCDGETSTDDVGLLAMWEKIVPKGSPGRGVPA